MKITEKRTLTHLAFGLLVALPAPALARSAAITAEDAIETVKFLSSRDLEGRGVRTKGLVRAGDYIADRFSAAGLRGGGDDGTFFQAVDIPDDRSFGPGTHLGPGGEPLVLGRDYSPNAGALAATGVAEVVFAGYGISLGAGKYDDYAGLDARGRTVLILRYAPGYDALKRAPADASFAEGATLGAKAENAVNHGAAAILIVDPPAQGPDAIDSLRLTAGLGPRNLASFHVSRAAADRLLAAAGQTVESLQKKIDGAGRPASFALPPAATIRYAVERKVQRSRNVVAILEGSDPALRDEAILIGAHYDHLGQGDEGGALDSQPGIHPGADDNASGTSAALEIADALGALPQKPRRSIAIVTFTGEEKGLVGSRFNASHLPPKKVVAMINMDMVGRMKGVDLEIGGSTTATELQPLVDAANQEQLKLRFPKGVVPNSDHASYLMKDIPALFLFTGLHPDYHRATDTWDKINAEGLAKSARLAYRVALALADRQEKLAFVAPKWTAMGGGRRGSVRLGIMPDYQAQNGAGVSDVMPRGAAAAAGIRKGDLIKSIAGKPVDGMDAYMTAMGGLKYGADVAVEIERDGKRLSLTVKLTPPPDDARPAGPPPPAPATDHP